MGANFRRHQALHRAHLDKLRSRTARVEKAEVDLQKCVAEARDWFRQAHKELRTAQGELAKCDVVTPNFFLFWFYQNLYLI